MRFREAVLFSFAFMLVSCGGLKLAGRSPLLQGHGINYLHVCCDPRPRVNIVIRPDPLVSLAQKGAWFVYRAGPGEQALFNRYAELVYQALLKERVFRVLVWQGRFSGAVVQRAQKGDFLLVVLEDLRVLAPTKVAPGSVALALRVLGPRSGFSLWALAGEMDLCPCYPKDWTITLTRGASPGCRLDTASGALFLLARAVSQVMRPASAQVREGAHED